MDRYIWDGQQYVSEDGDTWASPLEEIAAVTELNLTQVERGLEAMGQTVATVTFADGRDEGYPVKALILPASFRQDEMTREYQEVLDALHHA